MKKALFVLSGNCRTFTDCIDSICSNLVSKLFSEDVWIYMYLYLKIKDPGPRCDINWNFEYKNTDYNTIVQKIFNIKCKYPKYNIEYLILYNDSISDAELMSQVKDRSLYVGNNYSKDSIFLRGLHCHYNFEMCGNYILKKEKSINYEFDYIIYVRPDLFFTDCCNNIETYNKYLVTLGEGPTDYNNDHLAIIPKKYRNDFFFNRMKVYRNNTHIYFETPEEVYWYTIKYELKSIGKYYIKRS
jgi:hypothetical protein